MNTYLFSEKSRDSQCDKQCLHSFIHSFLTPVEQIELPHVAHTKALSSSYKCCSETHRDSVGQRSSHLHFQE